VWAKLTPHLHTLDAQFTLIGLERGPPLLMLVTDPWLARVLFYSPTTAAALHFTTSSFGLASTSTDITASTSGPQGTSNALRGLLLPGKESFRQRSGTVCWCLHPSENFRGNTRQHCDIVRSGIVAVAVAYAGAHSDWNLGLRRGAMKSSPDDD